MSVCRVFGNENARSASWLSVCWVFGNENVRSDSWLSACWMFCNENARAAGLLSVGWWLIMRTLGLLNECQCFIINAVIILHS